MSNDNKIQTILESYINILVEKVRAAKQKQGRFLTSEEQFSFQAMKALFTQYPTKELNAMKGRTYVDRFFKSLGTGSARRAYLFSSSKVLKVVAPGNLNKGVAQNKAEVEIFTDPRLKKYEFTTKIIDFDSQDYLWLLTELVKVCSFEEFNNFFGLAPLFNPSFEISPDVLLINLMNRSRNHSFQDACQLYIDFVETYDPPHAIKFLEETKNNKRLEKLFSFGNEFNLLNLDLFVYEHWGKTADGRIVLLDFGATDEVLRTYY